MAEPKSSLGLRILTGVVYAGLCACALVGGAMLGWTGQSQVLTAAISDTITNVSPAEVFVDPSGRPSSSINVLVLGCDEDRAYGGKVLRSNARSDMMLLAHLDFEGNRITGLSIPRDTLVRVPGYREQKINAYHAIGGKDLAKQAVESLTGVTVDRVAVLDYDAFKKMVDLVGGIEVYVPKRMKYRDRAGDLNINLETGRQVLDGQTALGFVRYRHSDSDFMRQQRQKDFMMAFKDALIQKPTLLGEVADLSVDLTGREFSPREVAAIARFAKRVPAEAVRMGMIPVDELDRYRIRVNWVKLQQTLQEYEFSDASGQVLSYRR